jgi:osmoprotectant transport system permease protein
MGALRLVLDTANAHTFYEGFVFIGNNWSFVLHKAWEQLQLSFAALGLGAAVALPVGILLGHLHRGSTLAIGASIVGRALPSILLIAVFLTVLGIGFVNNMAALAVLATGPMLTNAYEGVDGVDREVTDAAHGMGMSHRQILWRVELPLAVPLIFTGIRISAVTVVATAPIAAIAGGGGLGDIIVNQASYRLQGVLGACYCVMLLSAGVWVALLALQRAMTPRPLRSTASRMHDVTTEGESL